MASTVFQMYFVSGVRGLELIKTELFAPWTQRVLLCTRGKTSGAYLDSGTFQWTSAVKALCDLMLRHSLSIDKQALIFGGAGTSAASLDLAISKQTSWLVDMFGLSASGDSYAKKLVQRTNPNRKRPGPVTLSVNPRILAPEGIELFLDEVRVNAEVILRPNTCALIPSTSMNPRHLAAKAF